MLDSKIRPWIDPPLNAMATVIHKKGITANGMTLLGFGFGLLAMAFIAQGEYTLGGGLFLCNRLCDGFDGALARLQGLTDFGGFLDIVCDFIIYSGIVFSFGLSDPAMMGASAFLIFSFIGPMVSFLAYSIIAAKRHITTQAQGIKSIYYLGGLCEGFETTFALLLMCVLPHYFNEICYLFGCMCWLTTFGRIYSGYKDFKN